MLIYLTKKFKLNLFGVSEVVFIKYFESYQNRSLTLSLTYQVKFLDDMFSERENLNYDVPQGFILGLLLFCYRLTIFLNHY